MEIVEKHHNQKLDAPSGTALALADSMNEALNEKYAYVMTEAGRERREKNTRSEFPQCAVEISWESMK